MSTDKQPATAATGCPHRTDGDQPALFCPAYPQPSAGRVPGWLLFFRARHSWLHNLFERSYRMKMGEVHLFGKHVYMVNEPKWVRHVLVDAIANYPKHRLLGKALEPLLGESLITTNGAQWQRQRRMMNPAFENARLAVAFPLMLQAADELLRRLDALPDGAPHDMEIEMTHVTGDIIFRAILSRPMEGDDARRIFAAFAEFQQLAPRLSLPVIYGLNWLLPVLVPFWQRRRSRRAAAEIRNLLGALIRPRFDAHRQRIPGQTAAHDQPPPRDILEAMLDAVDETSGKPMSFDETLDQVAVLFLAGHETSASALTWALHLLANAPDVQQRLHAEVDRVLGKRTPQAGDLRELELTRQVFRETLRLFPPVGFLTREAVAGDQMRDKSIAGDSAVVISPWLIHRHRDLWSHPDAFDPDRFDTDAGRESAKTAYLPFGIGPRVCIGASFAMQEATLLLAMLAQRYRFEPVPGHVPEPVGRITIRSGNGVALRIFRR
ncbi:cytochrome P450 [Piscinibacter sakaiensis]|uniref:cytochrome P450 n=1 Tax=Piscinibacter sakaiensis TaxID=1547922 RepID=UPI003AAC053A